MKTKRVLIVDDQQQNLYLLRSLLHGLNVRVYVARNGRRALDLARRIPPDLIVSDILMPEMDGFALCRAWKRDPQLQSIPFLFYTATYTDECDKQFALSLGADRFLLKPMLPEELQPILQKYLEVKEPGQESSSTTSNPLVEDELHDCFDFLRQHNITLARKLSQKMQQLEKVNKDLRVQLSRGLETARREARLRNQLAQTHKLESIGRLAGGISHDFNNMLGVIIGNAELAMASLPAGNAADEFLEEIVKAAQRSSDITRQLLTFARKQNAAPQIVNLNHQLADMMNLLRRMVGERINLTLRAASDLWPVNVDPSQLLQIVTNLCTNARDAIPETGKIHIETDNFTYDPAYQTVHLEAHPGDYVMLAVSDTGHGLDRETREHLFEPFYTTHQGGTNSGLGLATVYGIVMQNGGFLHVYSEPKQGATFKIFLPRHGSPPFVAGPPHPNTPRQHRRTGATILVVEDDEAMLKVCQSMLRQLGHRVLGTTSPARALRLAEQPETPIDLLMTDLAMPEMNGQDLARQLEERIPGLSRIFMSGYTSDVVTRHGALSASDCFLSKPFALETLATTLERALS